MISCNIFSRLSTKVAAVSVICLTALPALAESGASESVGLYTHLGAGLGIGIASFGGALGLGRAVGESAAAIARNPGAAGQIRQAYFLGFVLIESVVIFSTLVALKLAGFF